MRRFLLLVLLFGLALLGWGYWVARAEPEVRRATIALTGWPEGLPPVQVALLSDIHIGTTAMDVGRLTRIVAQVNALRPGLVLIAGDFVFGHGAIAGARSAARHLAADARRPLRALNQQQRFGREPQADE